MPKHRAGAFSTPDVFLFWEIWPVALKLMQVPEIQKTFVQGALQLNCPFPEGSLPILNTATSRFLFLPFISLAETGNKSNLSSPLWQSYFTKLHQLLFSQTVIFSRQKSSDPFNHCSYSTPLASMLKNWPTDKHKCSERTAFDCRHCYKLLYPGWLMAFSFEVRHVCFFCPCTKEAQWTLASPSTHSQPWVLRQCLPTTVKKSRRRVSREASLLLRSEFSCSNYSEPYSELIRTTAKFPLGYFNRWLIFLSWRISLDSLICLVSGSPWRGFVSPLSTLQALTGKWKK